jgi:hypothetical protein
MAYLQVINQLLIMELFCLPFILLTVFLLRIVGGLAGVLME